MKPLSDPTLLNRLHSSIRSFRQAQRRAIQHWRTYEEAEEALDRMACDGLLRDHSRARVVMDATGSFTVQCRVETRHNQEQ